MGCNIYFILFLYYLHFRSLTIDRSLAFKSVKQIPFRNARTSSGTLYVPIWEELRLVCMETWDNAIQWSNKIQFSSNRPRMYMLIYNLYSIGLLKINQLCYMQRHWRSLEIIRKKALKVHRFLPSSPAARDFFLYFFFLRPASIGRRQQFKKGSKNIIYHRLIFSSLLFNAWKIKRI